MSREAGSLAVLAAGFLVLSVSGPVILGSLTRDLGALLGGAERIGAGQGVRMAARGYLAGVAWFALAAWMAGAAASVLQTGLLIVPHRLAPDLSRLSPLAGMKRLFGTDGLAETLKSVAKIGALGTAMWWALRGEASALASSPYWTMAAILTALGRQVARLLLAALAAQAAITGADLLWVRLRHARGLRMSRQDLRDEQRETDGDPRIKARIRQLRTARARRRMLSAVPKATVVVTNPTHYAVALVYDRGRAAAPRIVAKGADSMAARIRETAARHRVPVVANPPLARALYGVELDRDIPPQYFEAVARIIAYVWGLQRRAAGRP